MPCTGMNPRYSQKKWAYWNTHLYIGNVGLYLILQNAHFQTEKLAQSMDKNENVVCQQYCKGQLERQVLSAVRGCWQKQGAFFIEMWSHQHLQPKFSDGFVAVLDLTFTIFWNLQWGCVLRWLRTGCWDKKKKRKKILSLWGGTTIWKIF